MLDEKDKIIFEHLLNDCRTPLSYLSKITKLTKPTVMYRIEKLEKEGYISKYDSIFDFTMVFPNLHMIFIRLNENKKEIFEKYLKRNKNIFSIHRLISKYNYYLLCNLNEKTKNTLINYLEKETIEYSIYPIKKITFLPFSIFDINVKYKPKTNLKKIKTDKEIKLDDTDIKIINKLIDGCAKDSILELSRKTELKYDTVLYRFKRFQKENLFKHNIAQPGIEKFTLQTDMILLKTESMTLKQVCDKLSTIKKSPYVIQIDENTYFTQILIQSYEEYKIVLDKIWTTFSEKLKDLEIHNTKDWIILNRFNFDDIKKE